MIHLSRFLIGIRHTRVFRIKTLSGQLIDDIIKLHPKDFVKVAETPGSDEIALCNEDNSLIVKFTRDDILIDGKKLFDWEKKGYIEIDKLKVVDAIKFCLPIASKRLELDKDYFRIGIIFDFKIPKLKDVEIGKFIYDNFISFKAEGEGNEASLRFVYKLPVPGGGAIQDFKNHRNVIIIMNQSKGINEEGKEEDCFSVSVDIQRIFDPMQKNINVDEHYVFAWDYLNNVILPEFKAKGLEIKVN